MPQPLYLRKKHWLLLASNRMALPDFLEATEILEEERTSLNCCLRVKN